jgi:hypothetical protein
MRPNMTQDQTWLETKHVIITQTRRTDMKQWLIRQGRQKANDSNKMTHNIWNNSETILHPKDNISYSHSHSKDPQSGCGDESSEEHGLGSLWQYYSIMAIMMMDVAQVENFLVLGLIYS